ncbi:hypothetical protein ABBQ32_003370 [Trebouxia sp. C0010 RCD-2024]
MANCTTHMSVKPSFLPMTKAVNDKPGAPNALRHPLLMIAAPRLLWQIVRLRLRTQKAGWQLEPSQGGVTRGADHTP